MDAGYFEEHPEVKLIGTTPLTIKKAEDRQNLRIPWKKSVSRLPPVPWYMRSKKEFHLPKKSAIRSSFAAGSTLGGSGGGIAKDEQELGDPGEPACVFPESARFW